MRNVIVLVVLLACAQPATGTRRNATSIAGCPSSLATDDIAGLVVDPSYAYWSSGGAVRRVPKSGGDVETLIQLDAGKLTTLWLDGDQLWYGRIDSLLGPGQLWQATIGDPSSASLLFEVSDVAALAGNATDLYWRTGPYIATASRAGGGPRYFWQLDGVDGAPDSGFTVDDTTVYLEKLRGDGTRTLNAIDVSPRAYRQLAGPVAAAAWVQLASDDAALYWVTTDDTGSQLVRVPKSGDPATVIATSANHIGPIRSNGTTVVWQDWDIHRDPDYGDDVFDGALYAAPTAGGDATHLNDCTYDGVSSLAIDVDHVYWADDCWDCAGGDSQLFAQALPQ